MKDTLSFLVHLLLQKNKIHLDKKELDFQIKSHPSYPSLHAITGVLDHFNIDNEALQVPVNKETLSHLPQVFLAQVETENSKGFVIAIKNGDSYKLIFESNKTETYSLKEFLQKFTGIIVAVEKDINNTLTKSTNKRDTKLFAIIAISLFIALFFSTRPNSTASVHFILSVIGVAISFLIIQHDLGIDSKLVNAICSQESKTTNCDAVLNSKGAKLFSTIKLGDISFIYFVSISISAVLLQLATINFGSLIIVSTLSAPIIIYSIYYQAFVVKTWCKLCLAVVSVLLLQASLIFFDEPLLLNVTLVNVLILLFSIITIASLWLFVLSQLKSTKELHTLKIESTKFKRNFDLFNALLEKSEILNTAIPDTSEIIFGNKNASLNLITITNPFCGYCKSVHNLVEQLLKTYHDKISITIRFNINSTDLENDQIKVTSRLLELYQNEGEIDCLNAMHDIYLNKDAKLWLETWGNCKSIDKQISTLIKESDWCQANNINFTPEILVNGKAFPKAYDRNDLIYFIEDLEELCCNANKNLPFVLTHHT